MAGTLTATPESPKGRCSGESVLEASDVVVLSELCSTSLPFTQKLLLNFFPSCGMGIIENTDVCDIHS